MKNAYKLTQLSDIIPEFGFSNKKQESQFLQTLAGLFPANFVLPANPDVEEIIIGTIVMDSSAIALTFPIIRGTDFHNPRCRKVYDICSTMYKDGDGIDIITVTERYRLVHGESVALFLTEATNRVTSSIHVEQHCKLVKDYSMKRAMIQIGLSAVRAGLDDTVPGASLFPLAQNWLMDAMATGTSNVPVHAPQDITLQMVKRLDQAVQLKQEITGYRTGMDNVDRHFGGLQPSDLILLAARPSMGKTSCLISMVYHPGETDPEPVLIFSLEMNAMSLYYKLAAFETGISVNTMAKGQITEAELLLLTKHVKALENSNVYVVDASGLSIETMMIIARLMHHKLGIKLVGVDYVSLATTEDKQVASNPVTRVGAISAGLKSMAKQLQVPVVALSQLSRDVEKRGGVKMPQLSDLRESGALEQDADIVVFIHRPEYYKIDTWDGEDTEGLALFNIAKYRNGATDILKLHFDKTTTLFSDTWGKDFAQVQTIDITPKTPLSDDDPPF